MIVDRHTRQLAMYWVYRNTRMVDCFVGSPELEARWRQTGLRRDDLLTALREMTDRGYLTVFHSDTSNSYRLTQAGIAEFRLSKVAFLYTLAHWAILLRAWFRRFSPPGVPPAARPQPDRRRPTDDVDLHQCSGRG